MRLGDVRTTASPPWTAHQDTTLTDIENFNGNKVLSYGWAGGARGVSRSLPESAIVENNETATLFFRINSKTDDPDHNVGLGDQASTGTADFADFEAQLRLKQGTTAGTFALDARNGGAFTATLSSGLAINSWYNIWMVVNQSTDTYDLYMNTGTGAATAGNKLNATPLAFRNGTANPLQFDPGHFEQRSDRQRRAGRRLRLSHGLRPDESGRRLRSGTRLDGGDAHDRRQLHAEHRGHAASRSSRSRCITTCSTSSARSNLAGTLHVALAVGAASFAAGDEFDILDFGSLDGLFDAVVLPTLGAGLVWDNSQLLTDGVLAVAVGVPGDFNEDGQVDAADYTVWRDSSGQVGAGLAADGNRDLHVDDGRLRAVEGELRCVAGW